MKNQRPNILFFFPDQHRFDWLGSNPDIPVRTPTLDRLGQRGVRFTNAITPSPLCAPARACLAAGKEYDRCGVPGNQDDYPIDQPTFYTMLRDTGYHVAGCGKFDLSKISYDWGLDGKKWLTEWGFSEGINNEGKLDGILTMIRGDKRPKGPYLSYLMEKGLAGMHVEDLYDRYYTHATRKGNWASTYSTPLPDDAYCDNWIGELGLDLINRFPEGKPWFLQVNFTGPHQPLDITKEMSGWYKDVEFPQPNDEEKRVHPYPEDGLEYYDYIKKSWHEPHCAGKPHTPEQNNAVRQNYSAMVENIDRWVNIYLQEIEKRGELDNTLVVFCSDHGDMLGDHGYWEKHRPYQTCLGVPFIAAGPGVTEGKVLDCPVTILDLMATFLDYGQIVPPAGIDSLSMRPLFEGTQEKLRDYVFSALGDWRLVFDGRYKLIEGYGADPLFFDLKEDPFENDNRGKISEKEAARLSNQLAGY